MYERLHEHFRRTAGHAVDEAQVRRRIHAFTNAVATSSRAALFHAWALERLGSEFSPARTRSLSEEAALRVEQLRADHRHGEQRIAAALVAQLTEVVGVHPGEAVTPPPTADDARRLARAIERHRLLQQLFVASAEVETGSVSSPLARLLTMLRAAS
jgi:hypothetical protein